MVHLRALPGSPGYGGDFDAVLRHAVADLEALVDGGADGAIIENFFDSPFHPGRVPPVTIAAMTAAASLLRSNTPDDFLIGVNVLRNDAIAALSIASVVGASFIRVNVHTGVSVADQGFLIGEAHETARLRRSLGGPVSILADVGVKHASTLGSRSLEDEARDAVERGLADGVLVTGPRTGSPVDQDALVSVRTAVTDVPVLAASGVNLQSAGSLAKHCDGVVVGTWLKQAGRIDASVDAERVKQLSMALQRQRRA
jgi:membrane complex biogenesis BtpA family protein